MEKDSDKGSAPVEMLDTYDDRVECPEGAYVKALNPEHPIMRGIPWEECPPFLGYNEVRAKEGSEVLATICPEGERRDDPLIVVGEFGKGRVMVFISDPVPHRGINFIRGTLRQVLGPSSEVVGQSLASLSNLNLVYPR
ncbi:MAG: hypothetical protein DRJ43_04785 [Thermoprotei archaeon]|nr:MAG: hypothetical protein DRJ43_04785 [Thermoprotei archaeon]